eukprot:Nk52_evm11s303 gene=Nk52_evmTU11s303
MTVTNMTEASAGGGPPTTTVSVRLFDLAKGRTIEKTVPVGKVDGKEQQQSFTFERTNVFETPADKDFYKVHFLISTTQSTTRHRKIALCVYCGWAGSSSGERMTGHLKSCVGPMSESAKEAIGVWVNKWYYTFHPSKTTAKTTQKHARSIEGSTSATLDSLVQQYSLKRLNDLHTTLMLAFVTAGVPFNFANNTFFRKYQLMLGGSHYSAPSRTRLSSDLLVQKARDFVIC